MPLPLLLFLLLLLPLRAAELPNIVLIVSDDHHWGDYGFMGHAQVQTQRGTTGHTNN